MQTHQQKQDDLLCHLCGEYQNNIKFKSHVLRCYAKTIKINQNYNPSVQTKDFLQLLSQKKISTKEYNSLALKAYVQDSVFKCKKCEELILKNKMEKHKKICNKKKKKIKKPSIEDLFKEQIKKIFNSEQNIEEQTQPKKKKIKTEKIVKKIKKTEGTKPTIEKNKRIDKVQKLLDQKKANNISNFTKTAKKNHQSSKRFSSKLPISNTLNEQRKKVKLKKQQTTLEKKPSLKELMKKFTEIKKENPLNFSKHSRPQSKNKRPKSQLNSPQLKKIFTLKENQKSKENDHSNSVQKTPRKSKWMSKPREKIEKSKDLKQMFSATKSMVHDEVSFFTIFKKVDQQQTENQSQRVNKWIRKKITLTHMNSFDRTNNQRNKSAPSDKFKKLRDRNKKRKFQKNDTQMMTSSQVEIVKQDMEDIQNYGPIDYYGQANYEVFQQILHPCQFCSRTFLPQRLQKHQKVCFNFQSKLVEIKQQMNQNNEPFYHPKDKQKLMNLRDQILQFNGELDHSDKLNLLKDDHLTNLFQQPLDEIFLSCEANISEVFQKHNLTELTHKKFPINQSIMQFIAETAQELQISVLTVFTFFDEIVLQNPALQQGIKNFHLLQSKYLQTKSVIYQMYWESRKTYLLCLKDLLHVYYYSRVQQTQEIFQHFLTTKNNQDQILLATIKNLSTLTSGYNMSQFDWNNTEQLIEYKMEENRLLEEILQLLIINENIPINDNNMFKILDIFKARNFQSVLSQLMQMTRTNNVINNLTIAQYNKQSVLNQKIILLMMLLRDYDPNQKNDQKYQQKLLECNEQFGNKIDGHQAVEYQGLTLPILILRLLNQYYIYKNDDENSIHDKNENYQKFLDFIDSKYNEVSGDLIQNLLIDFCEDLKNSKSLFESVQQISIKKLLELLWMLFKQDQNLFYKDLQIKEPSQIFLMLFKEMTSNIGLYQDFIMQDYLTDSNLGSFVNFYLASYPLENANGFIYCQLIEMLLQNHGLKMCNEILDSIYFMKFITIEKINTELNGQPTNKKHFQDFNFQCFKLRQPISIQGFDIQQDSLFYQTENDMYIFQTHLNFFDHMIHKLLTSVLREDWNQYMTFDQLFSLFQTFCKIVTVMKYDEQSKFLEDNQRLLKVFVILTVIISDQRNFGFENSMVLFKAFKTLRTLLQGKYSELYKTFLLMTFYLHQGQEKNILIAIFEQTQELKKSSDFHASLFSKYVYKIQRELILIFQVFMSDDNLFLVQQDLNQTILGYKNNNQQSIVTRTFNYFTKLYSKDVQTDDQDFFDGFMSQLKELQVANYPLDLDLMNQCFEYVILPLVETQEYQIQSLWQSQQNYLLYQIKAETAELLCMFYKKFQFNKSRKILTYQQLDTQSDLNFLKTLINYSQKISPFKVIKNALEVRISKSTLRGMSSKKDLLIHNKHIQEVLKENQNMSCKVFIMQYINNSLELFSILLNIASGFITNKINLEFNLVNEFIDLFCFHEKFFSYEFNSLQEHHNVNMIVVLISLMQEPLVRIDQILSDAEKIYFLNIKLLQKLSEQTKNINMFMNNVSFNSVLSGYQYSQNYKKSNNIHNSVFKVLTSLINFWKAENNVSVQSLYEYVCGQYNRLPSCLNFEDYLNTQIAYSLKEYHEEVYNFLIACQQNQFEIIDSLFQFTVSSQNQNLKVVELLRLNLQFFKNLLSKENDQVNYVTMFVLKEIYFILKIFNEKRFSINLRNLIMKNLFDLFQDLFFETFVRGQSISDCNFCIISEIYRYQKTCPKQMAYDNCNIVNFIFMEFLKEQQILISQIGIQFIEMFQDSFYLQIQKKYNYIFQTKNIYFFQNLCSNLQKMVVFTSDSLATNVTHNFMQELSVQIENFVSDLNNTYTGVTQFKETLNYYETMYYAFQNCNDNSEGLSQVKNEYNPNKIYLSLKYLKKEESECRKIMIDTLIYNMLLQAQENKKNLQENLLNLYQTIFQIGFSGKYLSCNLNTLPTHGSTVYALQTMNNLKNFNKDQSNLQQDKMTIIEIAEYLKKINFDIKDVQKYGNSKNKQIFEIHDFENQLLYSCISSKFELSLVHIYHKEYFNTLEDIQIQNVRENIYSQLKDVHDMIVQALKGEEKSQLDQYSNLFKFYIFHLKALNYLHVNLFNLELNQDNSSLVNMVQHILQYLLDFKSDISEIFDSEHTKSQYFFEIIFYGLNYLCIAQHKCDVILTQNLYNFLQELVQFLSKRKNNTQKMIILLNCLTLVTRLNPSMVTLEHIDQLSKMLNDYKLDFQIFNLLMDYFKMLLHQKEISEKLTASDLYRKINNKNCVTEDDEFESPEFYSNNRVKQIHSKFMKVLTFFNESCAVLQDEHKFMNVAIQFFQNYHKRILMIIGFSDTKAHENKQFNTHEVPESFRTAAALDELHQIMILIAFLSSYVDKWKKQQENLVIAVEQILLKKTIKLFAKTYFFNLKNHSSIISTNTLSEKIIPKTTLEISMQKMSLQETSYDNNLPTNSLNASNKRATVQTQSIQRYNNMRSLITSLFSFKTDCTISSIIFYLGLSLVQFMNDPQLFSKLSLNFKDETELQNFHMKFSQTIIDCQSFISYMLMRVFTHSSLLLEANLKLRYLYGTVEAQYQMLGTCDDQQLISMTEFEELLRKAFEITVFLHIAYIEEMKESNNTLYEFNINQYNNNTRQIKDELRKYQQVNPQHEQFQIGSTTRRSISNSRLRSAQRRSLTSPIADFVQRDPNSEEALQKKKDMAQHQSNMEFLSNLIH